MISKEQEDEGQKWFMKAFSIMEKNDEASFRKHMALAKKNYYNPFIIISCIGSLTDIGATIDKTIIHPQINVEIINQNPLTYRLSSMGVTFNFLKLTTVLPFTNDGIPNQQRQGDCHEKAFEIASRIGENGRLVTALVSTLSDIHTYLHSWVEDEDSGCAYDYTMNSAYMIENYKILMNAQPPLIEVSSKDIKSGKVKYNDWAKKIHALYKGE